MNSQTTTFRLYAEEQRSPTTILIDTKQRQSTESAPQLGQENFPYVGLLFLITIVIFSFILLIFRYSRFGKMMAERTLTPGVFHTIPCRSCQYFCHNPYLNCAIHPSLVLTDRAIDCPDYCAKGERTETDHDVP